jgi:hypothetical protein
VRRNFKKVAFVGNSLLLLLCMVAATLSAQDRRLAGPLLGFVRDADDLSIKPIFGIPGAATIGPALDLPLHFFQIDFSVKNDYAIAVTEWTSELLLIKNLSKNATFESVFTSDTRIERIALSPNGAYAAFISGDVVRMVGGLPSNPTVLRQVNVPSAGQSLTAMAVNDKGEIAAAFFDGVQGTAYWSGGSGELKPVAVAGEISALAFVRDQAIVMADRLFNEVSLISDPSSNPSSVRLADAADEVDEPAAVQVSNTGSQVFVANQKSGTILTIAVAGGAPAKTACGCSATTLRALRGQSVFALTEPSGNPVMVFDGADKARVVVASND